MAFPSNAGDTLFGDLERHVFRTTRRAPKPVVLDQLSDFGPALLRPGLGIFHRLSVVQFQQVRQRVCANFRFGVVDGNIGDCVGRGVGDLTVANARQHQDRSHNRQRAGFLRTHDVMLYDLRSREGRRTAASSLRENAG